MKKKKKKSELCFTTNHFLSLLIKRTWTDFSTIQHLKCTILTQDRSSAFPTFTVSKLSFFRGFELIHTHRHHVYLTRWESAPDVFTFHHFHHFLFITNQTCAHTNFYTIQHLQTALIAKARDRKQAKLRFSVNGQPPLFSHVQILQLHVVG